MAQSTPFSPQAEALPPATQVPDGRQQPSQAQIPPAFSPGQLSSSSGREKSATQIAMLGKVGCLSWCAKGRQQ
jgi:hypothetical protein